MDETKLHEILEAVKLARSDPSAKAVDYYVTHMHKLAEAEYLPAISFFVSTLDDTRWDWREDSLTALGFHYDLRSATEILDKISSMLINDPNDFVRMAAASVLGVQSSWPNMTLVESLQKDEDADVRAVSFDAILNLLGVSFPTRRSVEERVLQGEIPATLEGVRRTLSEMGLTATLPTSDESDG